MLIICLEGLLARRGGGGEVVCGVAGGWGMLFYIPCFCKTLILKGLAGYGPARFYI